MDLCLLYQRRWPSGERHQRGSDRRGCEEEGEQRPRGLRGRWRLSRTGQMHCGMTSIAGGTLQDHAHLWWLQLPCVCPPPALGSLEPHRRPRRGLRGSRGPRPRQDVRGCRARTRLRQGHWSRWGPTRASRRREVQGQRADLRRAPWTAWQGRRRRQQGRGPAASDWPGVVTVGREKGARRGGARAGRLPAHASLLGVRATGSGLASP